jgi:hypothetical protein
MVLFHTQTLSQCHQFRLDGHSKCCLTLLSDVVLPGLSDAVVPDLVVRRSIADTTCRHTVYQYVQIPLFHITHLEYSSYTQTLFMGFLLLSEQNTLKRLFVKDPSVEFVKSRLLGAAAEAKFVSDPKFILWQWHSKLQTLVGKKLKVRNRDICNKWISEVGHRA